MPRIIHHARMQLECPHCQASYDIPQDTGDAVFICLRCAQEFCARNQPTDVETAQAPVRKTAHIWPWLLIMLMLLAATGFWVQKDAWLDNRWLRSALINIGVDLPLRTKDWRIAPESVRPQWISQVDGGKALLIRGDIQNLLSSDVSLPRISVIFFSKTEPDKQIGKAVLDITLAPTDGQAHQSSPVISATDNMPVAALGQRSFSIMVESVPVETGDFTLTPAPL